MSQDQSKFKNADMSEIPAAARQDIATMLRMVLLMEVVRQGGVLHIPIEAVDAAGNYTMNMEVDQSQGVFVFTTRLKS